MKAHQEESPGYPTQLVPSGARYSDRTQVYEFRSTEPHDPRNCQIPLPPITEEIFGTEESDGSYSVTAIPIIRGMPSTYSRQMEVSDNLLDEDTTNTNMTNKP